MESNAPHLTLHAHCKLLMLTMAAPAAARRARGSPPFCLASQPLKRQTGLLRSQDKRPPVRGPAPLLPRREVSGKCPPCQMGGAKDALPLGRSLAGNVCAKVRRLMDFWAW